MQQKKIDNILYVYDTTPYQITEDTDAEVIKVQEESYPGFVGLNESLADKFVKYNYKVICVNQQEWMPYINQPDPEPPTPTTHTVTLSGTDLSSSVVEVHINMEQVEFANSYTVNDNEVLEIFLNEDPSCYELASANMNYSTEISPHYWINIASDLAVVLNYTAAPTYAEVEVTYDVQDTESEIELFSAGGGSPYEGTPTPPDAMYVDDNQETVVNSWRFGTTGDHTVKFVFHSGRVSTGFMQVNQNAKSIKLNGQVTEIGENAFNSIQEPPFDSITSLAATPPILEGNGWTQFNNDVPIYVPADYVTAYQTAWTTYASQIQAMQS